jgi:hypothetical protein
MLRRTRHPQDICSAPMALCRRSLRNAAGTARRNGQRCRSQVEALERAGAEDRPSSAAPKPYGTLGSTSTTNSGRYRLTVSSLVNPWGTAASGVRPGALTPADYRLNVTTDHFVFGRLMLRITLEIGDLI